MVNFLRGQVHLDRLNPRVFLDQPAQRYLASEQRYEAVRIVDLSETGARLELSTQTIDGPLSIYWTPVVGMPPLLLRGRRVWRRGHLCGVIFEALDARVRAVLHQVVKHHRGES